MDRDADQHSRVYSPGAESLAQHRKCMASLDTAEVSGHHSDRCTPAKGLLWMPLSRKCFEREGKTHSSLI